MRAQGAASDRSTDRAQGAASDRSTDRASTVSSVPSPAG